MGRIAIITNFASCTSEGVSEKLMKVALIVQWFSVKCLDSLFFSEFFFHEHSGITGLQEKGEGISLTPHYHFHLSHRHLDIKWVKLAAELEPGTFGFQAPVANH